MVDPHECSNCYFIGDLSPQGRCQQCGSDAVLSLHALEILASEHTGIERHFAELSA